eukprot:CAMPEP_0119344862 /NCGR_PEP_ID=MMETSP1333-20130426/107188_1 /TAXON_ID=418940 /ORGANISM="Scyphosphaera apsteinii, Strain RCC1455" /LENGTH=65 /DNA_ID=CAMNT_0007357311 /DNA_START=74 /DNA_END=271 /DNA_ORIENTATION=-
MANAEGYSNDLRKWQGIAKGLRRASNTHTAPPCEATCCKHPHPSLLLVSPTLPRHEHARRDKNSV